MVLAVLDGLTFPGDVLATINPTTQTIVSTVNLETSTDTMGGLAVDGTRDYVWVTDATEGYDVVQNLNLAVTDPASQPYVTAVGGTTVSASVRPRRNPLGTTSCTTPRALAAAASPKHLACRHPAVPGHGLRQQREPCGNSNGDCREVPDVSADADPSTGYVIYDSRVDGYRRDQRSGTTLGRGARRRSVGRRQHRRLRRHEPDPLHTGAEVSGYLPQRRDDREQRLQRGQQRAVQRQQRIRHGDRAGDARHVGSGVRPHGDPARSRGFRLPGLRRDAHLRRDSRLRGGIEHHSLRSHTEHNGLQLRRGRDVDRDLARACGRELHASHLVLRRRQPLWRQRL